LKEDLPATEGLFTSILEARKPQGLSWILTALNDPNNRAAFSEPSSLPTFKEELKIAADEVLNDSSAPTEVIKAIKEIAGALNVELQSRRKIAFSTMREGKWDIFVMDEDGGNQTRLTDFPHDNSVPMPPQATHPTWSPDGKKIAFALNVHSDPGIYIMEENGNDQKKLIGVAEGGYHPAWSPDGKRIAFIKGLGNTRGLCVVDIDSKSETQLVSDNRQNEYPTWSPDGRSLAFQSAGQDGHPQIHIINLDGTDRRVLASLLTNDVEPQWSPDGTNLVFRSTSRGALAQSGIYLVDVHGNTRQLINPDPEANNPAWSPDGEKIAYVVRNGSNADIYVMNADGTNIRQLTKGTPGNIHPSWQPDSVSA
ncbi:MAG TPA: DPP IV N-terminal domain-containing protein, partial [Pyrinomonadaceae bacterium]|nr:DPP IV N-terminal domain-containing protein [Pyrinomonadaceae bacterium]